MLYGAQRGRKVTMPRQRAEAVRSIDGHRWVPTKGKPLGGLDPTKVFRTGLKNAASGASPILATGATGKGGSGGMGDKRA